MTKNPSTLFGPGVDPATVRRSRRHQAGPCPCCGRRLDLTFHHLIPRKLHRRPRFRKLYDRETLSRGVYVCRECHDAIHTTYSEMELAKARASLNALLADPVLARHFAWLSRQRRHAASPCE